MKSQRRHDIEADKLSRQMHGFPELVRQNASKIFLAATLIVLVVVLIRYRNDSAKQREATARAALSRAGQDLQQLQNALMSPNATPQAIAAARNQLTAQTIGDLGDVLGNTDDTDTVLRAETYATRGDLYWALANAPTFAEAATQPSLAGNETPEAQLAKAEADYKHILDAYPNQKTQKATALFGLAAIAEDRHNWDEAKKRYDEIEVSDLSDMDKQNAKSRAGLLDRLKEPVQIGALTTQPTTAQSAAASTTQSTATVTPSTMPGSQP